jgi:hypothetical protein
MALYAPTVQQRGGSIACKQYNACYLEVGVGIVVGVPDYPQAMAMVLTVKYVIEFQATL